MAGHKSLRIVLNSRSGWVFESRKGACGASRAVEKLRALTDGRTLVQLAIQFVLAHPAVTLAIPGAKRISQLEENIRAALLPPLTPEELQAIDEITPPGGGRKIWPA